MNHVCNADENDERNLLPTVNVRNNVFTNNQNK